MGWIDPFAAHVPERRKPCFGDVLQHQRKMRTLILIAIAVMMTAGQLHAQSAKAKKEFEQLEFLTTVGFFTGAADACRVAEDASKVVHRFINIAIDNGNYGDRVEARTLYENARRSGIGAGAKPGTDCAKVDTKMRAILNALFPKN